MFVLLYMWYGINAYIPSRFDKRYYRTAYIHITHLLRKLSVYVHVYIVSESTYVRVLVLLRVKLGQDAKKYNVVQTKLN